MTKRIWIAVLLTGLAPTVGRAAEGEKPKQEVKAKPSSIEQAILSEGVEATDSPRREELERKFTETLSGAVMKGRWCMVNQGEMGEERTDQYTITRVNKAGDDLWLFYVRIQYGERNVVVPLSIQVKWAGDTPVISVTDMTIAGLGTYTARVVIYGDRYAGTWSGSDHGGLMYGVIKKLE